MNEPPVVLVYAVLLVASAVNLAACVVHVRLERSRRRRWEAMQASVSAELDRLSKLPEWRASVEVVEFLASLVADPDIPEEVREGAKRLLPVSVTFDRLDERDTPHVH